MFSVIAEPIDNSPKNEILVYHTNGCSLLEPAVKQRQLVEMTTQWLITRAIPIATQRGHLISFSDRMSVLWFRHDEWCMLPQWAKGLFRLCDSHCMGLCGK